MISKVEIHKYLIVKQFNSSTEIETNTYDITDLLFDEEYKLNYRLEFGDILEQIPSDIELKFDNDLIPGQNFTLREFLLGIPTWYLQFAGISIYLDDNTLPEFWGQIDFTSLVYDELTDTISFTAFDFIKKYMDIWKEKTMPNIWNDYDFESNLDEILNLIIGDSTLLTGYNYNCGSLNNAKISMQELRRLDVSEDDDPYNIEEYLNILRKKFLAYIFIDNQRKLNFVSINQYIEEAEFDESKVINSELDSFPYQRYTACVVSYYFTNLDGYQQWQEGVQYYPGDLVKYSNYLYRCLLEHQSTHDLRPDIAPGGYWEFVQLLSNELIYPNNYMFPTPFAVLIESGGNSYVLPYYENATQTDWGTPTSSIDDLVKEYRRKHLESYLNLIPDVRVPKWYALFLELDAKAVFRDVTVAQIYNVVKQVIPDKYLEQRIVSYDGYNFRLMQKVLHKGKYFIIVGITKNLNTETSELILREFYE